MSKKQKELRHMSRTELIEIIYALQQKEKELQQQLDEANARLAARAIKMEQVGSIAEAALSLNDVFENAQAAANQYLESLQALCDREMARCVAAQQASENSSSEYGSIVPQQAVPRIHDLPSIDLKGKPSRHTAAAKKEDLLRQAAAAKKEEL